MSVKRLHSVNQKAAAGHPRGGCTPPAPSPWIRPCLVCTLLNGCVQTNLIRSHFCAATGLDSLSGPVVRYESSLQKMITTEGVMLQFSVKSSKTSITDSFCFKLTLKQNNSVILRTVYDICREWKTALPIIIPLPLGSLRQVLEIKDPNKRQCNAFYSDTM